MIKQGKGVKDKSSKKIKKTLKSTAVSTQQVKKMLMTSHWKRNKTLSVNSNKQINTN